MTSAAAGSRASMVAQTSVAGSKLDSHPVEVVDSPIISR